jgi:hypothetical protein
MKNRAKIFVITLGIVAICIAFKIFVWDRKEQKLEGENEVAQYRAIETENGRKRFSVPPIESDWVMHRRTKNSEYWTTRVRGVFGNFPVHLAKTIMFEGDSTILEKDDFHYQVSDSLGYRLVLVHGFLGNEKWKDLGTKFITYTFEEYSNVSSRLVNDHFADSVLLEWSLIAKKPLVSRATE